MITKEQAKNIIDTYGKAWEKRDAELVLTIFDKNAEFCERSFADSYKGHDAIRKYWTDKVVKDQKDIKFKLLSFWIDGDTVIAEWEVKFFEISKNEKKHIKEVAIMKIKNDKIVLSREYWHSKKYKD